MSFEILPFFLQTAPLFITIDVLKYPSNLQAHPHVLSINRELASLTVPNLTVVPKFFNPRCATVRLVIDFHLLVT